MSTVVTSQVELNAALDADSPDIIIDSPRGVWLTLDRGVVSVRGKSQVGPVGGSATVSDVGGSATVSGVWGSATVRGVRDSATVRGVRDSATVRLHDSASATNVAPYVAVHLHSARATTDGGVVINIAALDLTAATDWCDYHGVKISKAGIATVFKAVTDNWTTPRGFDYSPGKKPTAPDWTDNSDCGGGLHFSPTPRQAQTYHPDATRFVSVGVKLADLRPVPGGTAKCKAPAVVRACREVDIDGNEVKS